MEVDSHTINSDSESIVGKRKGFTSFIKAQKMQDYDPEKQKFVEIDEEQPLIKNEVLLRLDSSFENDLKLISLIISFYLFKTEHFYCK